MSFYPKDPPPSFQCCDSACWSCAEHPPRHNPDVPDGRPSVLYSKEASPTLLNGNIGETIARRISELTAHNARLAKENWRIRSMVDLLTGEHEMVKAALAEMTREKKSVAFELTAITIKASDYKRAAELLTADRDALMEVQGKLAGALRSMCHLFENTKESEFLDMGGHEDHSHTAREQAREYSPMIEARAALALVKKGAEW